MGEAPRSAFCFTRKEKHFPSLPIGNDYVMNTIDSRGII